MTDSTGASAALRRIGVHLLTAFAVLVGGVAMTSTAVDGAGVWVGRCVTGAATMYAGLGVSVFKEGVPGLLFVPSTTDVRVAVLAVLTTGYGDFVVRQNREQARERENPRPAEAERGF